MHRQTIEIAKMFKAIGTDRKLLVNVCSHTMTMSDAQQLGIRCTRCAAAFNNRRIVKGSLAAGNGAEFSVKRCLWQKIRRVVRALQLFRGKFRERFEFWKRLAAAGVIKHQSRHLD